MCCAGPLVLAAVTVLAATAPCDAAAQGTPPDIVKDPTVASQPKRAEPFLDRKVGSALEQFSRWKARMKKEHFVEYLAAYTGLTAGIMGLVFGLVAYRMSDPMAPYRLIRRRTLQLVAATGGAVGIFAAVTQVHPNATGKVSLLVLATTTGTIMAFIGAWFAFLALRVLGNSRARRDGRRVTDRMRHA